MSPDAATALLVVDLQEGFRDAVWAGATIRLQNNGSLSS